MNLATLIDVIKNASVEKFGVAYLAEDHKTCVGAKLIASGDTGAIRGISLDKILFEANMLKARGMVLMHNHPKSGQDKLRPSVADLETTFAIHDVAKRDGIPVLNHIIYGKNNSTFSFIHNEIQI